MRRKRQQKRAPQRSAYQIPVMYQDWALLRLTPDIRKNTVDNIFCLIEKKQGECEPRDGCPYHGKIIGGIYDDRFLVKPTKTALALMPDANQEIPYEGAKEMLLMDNVDNREFLTELLTSMFDELPEPQKKK